MLVPTFWQFIQCYVDTKTPKIKHTTSSTSTQKHTCYPWLVQLRNFNKYFFTGTWFGLPCTVTAGFVLFSKHVVLLQVGRAALCATPPVTCPVTSSLLRTQATLSHVRGIHSPSPSWLTPVLCQCWRSHGTLAFLDGTYISRALWCALRHHNFCNCLSDAIIHGASYQMATHATDTSHVRVAWLNSWLRSRWAGFPWSQRQALDPCCDTLGPSALTKFPQTFTRHHGWLSIPVQWEMEQLPLSSATVGNVTSST